MNKRTFVIAEAGSNHNRDLKTAITLIQEAARAGCDAVKFQLFRAESLYAQSADTFRDLLTSLEFPRQWIPALKIACDDANIEFMATPFDEEAVDLLFSSGVKRFKIAGFESLDPRFVKIVASTGLPIIFSAGIGSSKSSVLRTIEWIREENNIEQITVLHCNHAYPTPLEDINLGTIQELLSLGYDKLFKVGFSDHTTGIFVPPLAVAAGASMIEKHFTLSRDQDGPDHSFAIEPQELRWMIENIRRAELALNVRQEPITRSELLYEKAMRSIVTCDVIKKGERFTTQNLTTSRPFFVTAIPASNFFSLIENHFAIRDLQKGTVLLTTDAEKL